MKKRNIDLSICIVSWNISKKLIECLGSIYKHSKDLNIEVLVFDNASSDNTVEMIKNNFPQITLIENQTNIGFGRGNNVAINKSNGNYVLLINPDILIVEPCLKKMIKSLETLPQAGVIGCKLVNIDGSIQKSYFEKFPTPISELFWGMMLHKIFNYPLYSTTNITSNTEIAWIVGGCMMLRREVIAELKGFDERFFMYGEDIDLCFRIKNMGLKSYYLPNIKMLHYHGVSSKKQKKRYFAAVMQREAMKIFMEKHYGESTAFLYQLIWMVSGLVRVFLLLVGFVIVLLTFNNKKLHVLFETIENYVHIVSWGFGFEKWCRKGDR